LYDSPFKKVNEAGYGFTILLQPAVNESIEQTVNDESSKYVYVMSEYGKGPIRRRGHILSLITQIGVSSS
jgi:hypothetical protein